MGETGRAKLSKSLIQFSVDGWGCVPSLLFDLRSNYGGDDEDNGDLFQKSHARTATLSAPDPVAIYLGFLFLYFCLHVPESALCKLG